MALPATKSRGENAYVKLGTLRTQPCACTGEKGGGRGIAPKGAVGQRPASGGAAGRQRLGKKRKRGRGCFLITRWSLDWRKDDDGTVEEIGAGGQKSRSAAASLVGGARDPADSKRYTCKLPIRRRSEGERLGRFIDDKGARAVAMVRRPALQLGGKGDEGTRRRGSLDVGEEEAEGGPGVLK
jgi:hypothetical protein